jgi:Rrf2 family protein
MLTREVASRTGVPPSYLSKILTALRRAEILDGTRGKRGGYYLARDPAAIRLIDVVKLFETVRPEGVCLLGRNEPCSENHPCHAHDEWQHVCSAYATFLTSRTIADIAKPPPEQERA